MAAAAGVVAGWAGHEFAPDAAAAARLAGYFSILSDVFLRLIKMIIAPLVFATVVAGITGMGDASAVGRIGAKALLWFITASLVSLLLGMFFANLFHPGLDLGLPLPEKDLATNLKTGGLNLREFIAHVFPRSFFEAMATNEILQILVFSCFFGFAITTLKSEPAKTITSFISEMVPVMLKVTDFVMWFAPAGVFGAVAAAITTQGLGILLTYGKFIGSFYTALLVLWALLIGAGFVFLGPRVFRLMGMVKEPLLVAFTTASSEAAYPKLMEQLHQLRRQRPRHLVRAAARLLVQPRRFDALPVVRGAVHRAGLRHRDELRPATHAAAGDDGQQQGRRRRAARLARRRRGGAADLRPA